MKKITTFLYLIITLFLISCGNNKTTPIEDDQSFVEVFHGIEQIYSNDYFKNNQVQYLDYLIQKYQLWNNTNLLKYKQLKDLLQTDDEKRQDILLKVQKFTPSNTWKQEYSEIENQNEQIFLDMLKQSNPDLHANLQNLLNDDLAKAEEAFKKIYPSKTFPKDEWQKQQEMRKQYFKETLRAMTRKNFEEALSQHKV